MHLLYLGEYRGRKEVLLPEAIEKLNDAVLANATISLPSVWKRECEKGEERETV